VKLLNALRHRAPGGGAPGGAGDATGPDEDQVPIAGYDRLDAKHVIAKLDRHPQVELAAIERYERAHEGRPEVLNKLRYLRGSEPVQGYDALDEDEIAAALPNADVETMHHVREYENKFRRRAPVLNALANVRGQRRRAAAKVNPRG
jgi:hypothetical protein